MGGVRGQSPWEVSKVDLDMRVGRQAGGLQQALTSGNTGDLQGKDKAIYPRKVKNDYNPAGRPERQPDP